MSTAHQKETVCHLELLQSFKDTCTGVMSYVRFEQTRSWIWIRAWNRGNSTAVSVGGSLWMCRKNSDGPCSVACSAFQSDRLLTFPSSFPYFCVKKYTRDSLRVQSSDNYYLHRSRTASSVEISPFVFVVSPFVFKSRTLNLPSADRGETF